MFLFRCSNWRTRKGLEWNLRFGFWGLEGVSEGLEGRGRTAAPRFLAKRVKLIYLVIMGALEKPAAK